MPCDYPAGASVVGHSLRPIGLGGAGMNAVCPNDCSGLGDSLHNHSVTVGQGTLLAKRSHMKGKEERQSARALPQSFCPQPHRGGLTTLPIRHFERPIVKYISYLT